MSTENVIMKTPINESLSDVFGEFVDLTSAGVGNDSAGVRWLMGEDRDQQNPSHPKQPSGTKMKTIICLTLICAASLQAQTYTSAWSAFDSGVASSQSGAVAHRGLFGSWACHPLQSANYEIEAEHPSLLIPESPGEAPSLRISLVGNNVRVSWPASASSFVLEENPTPANGSWADVAGPYQSDGNERFILVPAVQASGLYRLRSP